MKTGPTAIPQPGIAYTWQVNPSFGGPIMQEQAVVLLHLQVRGQQDLRRQLARSPTAAAPSARRRATTARVGRLTWQAIAARQDPLLSRSAVQRRVLQRLQHAADDDAGSVDRRVRPRLGAAGQVDADDHRTSCCSRPASRTTTSRTSRTTVRTSAPRDLPRLEQTTDRLSVAARQHHSALHQLDEELQRRWRRPATSPARTPSRPA